MKRLVTEVAITPEVLKVGSYESERLADILLDRIRELANSNLVLRDLRAGEWSSGIETASPDWHRWARELIAKFRKTNRIIAREPAGESSPTSEEAWCLEALASAERVPLAGTVVSTAVGSKFRGRTDVYPIDRLGQAPWWSTHGGSLRLSRNTSEYLQALEIPLRFANLICFIDPYIDPEAANYAEFISLLLKAADRSKPKPVIEIHRQEKSDKIARTPEEWAERFERGWGTALADEGLSAELFIWDRVHDRYLLSDIVGVMLPYGFDIALRRSSKTTWTLLDRDDRDAVQLEFARNSIEHTLLGCARIGARQS